jgi:hypothetical protein
MKRAHLAGRALATERRIMPMKNLLAALTMASGAALLAAQSANAANLPATPAKAAIANSMVHPAVAGGDYAAGLPKSGIELIRRGHGHWRGHHRHHGHWRGGRYYDDYGAAIALGFVGALIAQGLSEDDVSDRIAQCEATFRSFEPDTGLYTTYSGEKRVCPYLR